MSTTKRSKKDSKTISEASGNGQTNGNTNGSNGHSNGHKDTLDDFAEKKLAAEQYYLDTCERYKVIPDAAIVISLQTGSNVIKPRRVYTEAEFLALAKFLMIDDLPLKVTKLDLHKSKIGSNGTILLAELLKTNKTITHVNISENDIGPRGAYKIAEAIQQNTTLTHLQMKGNKLFVKGARAIADALASPSHSLTFVDLEDNMLSFEGVTLLQKATADRNEHNKAKGLPSLYVEIESNFVIEEIFNSITHGIGVLLALFGVLVLCIEARTLSWGQQSSLWMYSFSLLFLYTMSTLYHSFFKLGITKIIFQRLDHAAIYFLIAGTYTPLLQVGYPDWEWSFTLLVWQWGCAVIGIIIDMFFPQYFSYSFILYPLMGWGLFIGGNSFFAIASAPVKTWLMVGGVFYTGGIFFYKKGDRIPLYHAIWHLCVLVASIAHWYCIFNHVVLVVTEKQRLGIPNLNLH
jgi:hemolysin III